MKDYQESIDQIEQYLEGNLDDKERTKVEESIANDKKFANNVENYKFLMDGIKYSGRNSLYQKLQDWDQELSDNITSEKQGTKIRSLNWYYVAASVVFFVVASALVYTNMFSGYERIAGSYYEPYNHYSGDTRGEKTEVSSLNAINQYYDQGRYAETIDLINKLDLSFQNEEIKFLLANSYMALDKFDEAIILFKEVSDGTSGYHFESKWYLALCYLYIDEFDRALPLLEELSLSTSSKSINAKRLLEDLN